MATLSTLVRRAVKDAAVKDAATAALAVHYATLIDAAAPARRYAAALRWLAAAERFVDGEQHADTIRGALAQHSVASDLGPKLLAALEALQLTPRARTAKEAPDGRPATVASKLDELAGRRARRGRAEALDAPAP